MHRGQPAGACPLDVLGEDGPEGRVEPLDADGVEPSHFRQVNPMNDAGDRPVASPVATQPQSVAAALAALERLAAALSPHDFATTLITGDGRQARLTVTSRHTPLSEEITAGGRAYQWSWAEAIAPLTDPCLAARRITRVLGAGLD